MTERMLRIVGLTKDQVDGLEFGPDTSISVTGQLTSVEKHPDFSPDVVGESEPKKRPLIWEIAVEFDPKSVKISQGKKNTFEQMADEEEGG